MIHLRQRDLIIIEHQFSDMTGKKIRPALVISNDTHNKSSTDCILLPLTSIMKEYTYSLVITTSNLEQGKLHFPSRIKIDRPFSADQRIAIKTIGAINEQTFKEVRNALFTLF